MRKYRFSKTAPILLLAALLTPPAFAAASSQNAPTVLEGVQVRVATGHLEVLLKVTGTYTFETFDLTAPKRLVVDIKPAEKSLADPVIPVDAHGVVRIRTGQFQSDTSRVVFDLMDVMPANKVTSGPEGITISFWVETAGQTPVAFQGVETERRVEPARAAEMAPVRPAPVQAAPPRTSTQEPVSGVNRQNLSFLEVKGGALFILRPETVNNTSFSLYGETATFVETYKAKLSFPFQISFGRIFALGGTPVRAGLAGQLWLLRQDGLYEATLPSPVAPNAPRTATLTEPLSSSLISIYLFAQFPFVSNEKSPPVVRAHARFRERQSFRARRFRDPGRGALRKGDAGQSRLSQGNPVGRHVRRVPDLRIHHRALVVPRPRRERPLFRADQHQPRPENELLPGPDPARDPVSFLGRRGFLTSAPSAD